MKNVQQTNGVMLMQQNGRKKKQGRMSGYDKKYRHSIYLNSDGVVEDYINWCHKHCKYRWGWWYETTSEWETHWDSRGNKAYMSFANCREALAFWFANCDAIYNGNY